MTVTWLYTCHQIAADCSPLLQLFNMRTRSALVHPLMVMHGVISPWIPLSNSILSLWQVVKVHVLWKLGGRGHIGNWGQMVANSSLIFVQTMHTCTYFTIYLIWNGNFENLAAWLCLLLFQCSTCSQFCVINCCYSLTQFVYFRNSLHSVHMFHAYVCVWGGSYVYVCRCM